MGLSFLARVKNSKIQEFIFPERKFYLVLGEGMVWPGGGGPPDHPPPPALWISTSLVWTHATLQGMQRPGRACAVVSTDCSLMLRS